MIGYTSFVGELKRQSNFESCDEYHECKKIPKLVLKKLDPEQITNITKVCVKEEPVDCPPGYNHQLQNGHIASQMAMLQVKKEENDGDYNLVKEEEENSSMSDYEKTRLNNIQANAAFFASLNIFKAKEQLSSINSTRRKNSRTPKTKLEKPSLPQRAPSLRLRSLGPDGKLLPPKPVIIRYIDEITAANNKRNERLPSGPIEMIPTDTPIESSRENSSEEVSKMIKYVTDSPYPATTVKKSLPADQQALCRSLSKMRITPERVTKVTKERVYSVAVHPSRDKVLVCVGDRGGRLGLWDVESSNDDNNGILVFAPHASPVNCLHFAPANPGRIFSSSYDGTIRCGDFERGVFEEVYATSAGRHIYISHFDFLKPDGSTLLAAQNDGDGYVALVDTRTRSGAENVYRLHDKSIRTVSVHPTKNHYIVTGSKDGTVALWDTRSLKSRAKNKHISRLQHGGTVSAAYFSPLTGQKILTTANGDTLRVYNFNDDGSVSLKTNIRHNNFVGRWLTNFRAIWHPQREDVFVSGSMERPRRIEVFNDNGVILHNFLDEECLGSICSINAFHPTRNILAGGNSSGRMHVFM